MPIPFSCIHCGKKLKAPDDAAGKKVRCPACLTVMAVPRQVYDAEEIDEPPEVQAVYSFQEKTPPKTKLPDEEEEEKKPDRRPCPMCGEMILRQAVKCRYCGEVFDPKLRRLDRRRGGAYDPDVNLSAGDWVVAVLCSGIGCIMGIVWIAQGKPKGGKMLAISLGFALFWNLFIGILRGILGPH
jgi:predicted RNA-binding Zn-ribbon protein involved in translation (DUF1610 family)